MFEIKDAVNDRIRILAAIQGKSGTGKTFTSLLLARGLVGQSGVIGVLDSEGGRSKVYAGHNKIGNFKILELSAPHSSERFKLAFKQLEEVCDVIIIDSISHEHQEMLEFADRLEKGGAKGVQKWTKPKIERKRFYSAILNSTKHVIVTMRMIEKLDIDTLRDKDGAKRFLAVDGDQRLQYEMDIVLTLEDSNKAKFTKVPEPLHGHIEQGAVITIEHGARLLGALPSPSEDSVKIKRVIANLEDAANSGIEVFRNAWEAAWRNASKPEREKLEPELGRLKQIAQNADDEANETFDQGAAEANDNPSGE